MDVAQLQRDVNTFVHTVDYLERGGCMDVGLSVAE